MKQNDLSGAEKLTKNKKRILMLQGPVGTFFSVLQKTLLEEGHEAKHVIFNFADLVFSSRKELLFYRQAEDEWSEWVRQTILDHKIDLMVIFGCERERHAIAASVAKDMSIPVLCLEEGYVRPGFITVEMGGNNRHSPLRHLTREELEVKPTTPAPKAAKGHAFGKMAWFGFYYYILRVLGLPFFAKALHHKTRPVFSEAFYWIRNSYRKITRRSQNFEMIETLLEKHRGLFYIVPLQVRDDMQLVKAGRGWTNEKMIEKTIASFAKHAPKKRLLVFKIHPLERGHSNADKHIAKIAKNYNCQDRVICLDDGSIGLLTRDSAGMITINSTSAFSAMLRKVPLAVLGDAMFRNNEIAYCINNDTDLDNYWRAKKSNKLKLASSFRNHMTRRALLPGDYYAPQNRVIAAKNISQFIQSIVEHKSI